MHNLKVYGRNPVLEALKSDFKTNELYIDSKNLNDPKLSNILEVANSKNVKVTFTNRIKLDEMSDGNIHQGVMSFVKYVLPTIDNEIVFANPGIHIYVRETTYEQNLGAIIRSAECAGLKSVIIPPKQEVTGTIARTSMGAIFHIPVYSGSLFPTIELFAKNQYDIVGIERGGENLFETKFLPTTLLIIGGEDHELSEPVIKRCNKLVTIPQLGKVNSLNMSVAAAIVMFNAINK